MTRVLLAGLIVAAACWWSAGVRDRSGEGERATVHAPTAVPADSVRNGIYLKAKH